MHGPLAKEANINPRSWFSSAAGFAGDVNSPEYLLSLGSISRPFVGVPSGCAEIIFVKGVREDAMLIGAKHYHRLVPIN